MHSSTGLGEKQHSTFVCGEGILLRYQLRCGLSSQSAVTSAALSIKWADGKSIVVRDERILEISLLEIENEIEGGWKCTLPHRTRILFIYDSVVTASYQASVVQPGPCQELHTRGLIVPLQLCQVNFC